MGKIAVIVSSHGPFARAAMESVEMVIGKQDNYDTVCVDMDMHMDDVRELMEKKYENLDTSHGTVILVDVLGGTPSNVSGMMALKYDNVLVFSGLNFPLLIQLFFNQEASLSELEGMLERAYQEGFHNITKRVRESEGDEDECEI